MSMVPSTLVVVEKSRSDLWSESARDWYELGKPRISAMVLVTVTLSSYLASQGRPDFWLLLHTLIGTTLVALSSSAWNQWWEQEQDRLMPRTADRPLPSGRMSNSEVITLGLASLLVGLGYLWLTTGWSPAVWSLATWFVYVCVYTPLKMRTSWNTVVGAVSGALPILIGWSAVGAPWNGHLGGMLCVLFFWQFPHFAAIAWLYRKQYARAGLKMLTVTDPSGRVAGYAAAIGSVFVLGASWLPAATSFSWLYLAIATVLGLVQFGLACNFQRQLDDRSARWLLTASIIYLPFALGLIAVQTGF